MTKYLVNTIKIIIILLLTLVIIAYFYLRASLPKLDGQVTGNVLTPVSVTRDNQGIPTIVASSREDLSFALGYLHGQERFFQMDLLRRNSAGELSELFGKIALQHDKAVRVHQFRKRVHKFVNLLTDKQQSILKQYTKGVNQGLSDLSAQPFEYTLLNAQPSNWQPEDSLLVLYSMYMDLQYEFGDREQTLGVLKALLPEDSYRFLTPEGSNWDAAIDNTEYAPTAIPNNHWQVSKQVSQNNTLLANNEFSVFSDTQEALKGSNNWAVSGAVSKTGSAIVADDMHLGIGVPNIWYRASLRYQDIKLDGVTLPGTPAIVVGSNHKVAWGFTNSYGDWNDLIRLKLSDDKLQYLTPQGYKDFDTQIEHIKIKGENEQTAEVKVTQWGPVIGTDEKGNMLVMRWVAHDSQGINFNLLNLESAQDVAEAVNIAHTTGIPAQNFMVGDSKGNIAWTIAGPMPKKFGLDNTGSDGWAVPQDWSNGDKGWQGYLPSSEYPVVMNPESNRLWTGNSRVVGNDMYQAVGNGGYALGARSQQIRDGLMAIEQFTEQDLLDIQNDDRAVFLTPWQELLTQQILTPEFIQQNRLSTLFVALNTWQARASVDSVGYLFIRQFRLNLRDEMFADLTKHLTEAGEDNKRTNVRAIRHQLEIPMWQLLSEQPQHLVPNGYNSWLELQQTVVLQTYQELVDKYGSIEQATWGAHNTTKIQHPLSKAVPQLSWLLDMPSEPVRGDTYMPRVQGKAFGSSQRMVVSPGFEQQAIFHMPSTQSGHPLSPFYGKGHDDWVKGEPSPLLPGETEYKLEFLPK
jgi:penicillin amidase